MITFAIHKDAVKKTFAKFKNDQKNTFSFTNSIYWFFSKY